MNKTAGHMMGMMGLMDDDAKMLCKVLEISAAQALALKKKIRMGHKLPSWAEYKVYKAGDSLKSATASTYSMRDHMPKITIAIKSGALNRRGLEKVSSAKRFLRLEAAYKKAIATPGPTPSGLKKAYRRALDKYERRAFGDFAMSSKRPINSYGRQAAGVLKSAKYLRRAGYPISKLRKNPPLSEIATQAIKKKKRARLIPKTGKKKHASVTKALDRKRLEAAIELFLKRGGDIKKVPSLRDVNKVRSTSRLGLSPVGGGSSLINRGHIRPKPSLSKLSAAAFAWTKLASPISTTRVK